MNVKPALYTILQPLLGEVTIWSDQNAPRPAKPYVALKLTNARSMNYDFYDDPDGLGNQKILGDREFTLSIQRFGDDSVQILQNFMDKLRKTTVLETLYSAKIALIDTSLPVTDISALLDKTQIEQRASVDLRFRFKQYTDDVIEVIETFEIAADDDSTAPSYIVTVDVSGV